MRRAWLTAIALAALVGGAIGVSFAAEPTQAAWTDRAHASAVATAGAWQTDGCVAMTAGGKPVAGGTCRVTSSRFEQWSDGTSTVRDYYISVTLSDGSGYAAVSLDLSAVAGASTWNWSKAATIPTGQFTPVTGFACSELPVLRANGPTNWGTSYAFWVRVVQDKTAGIGSGRNCA